MNSHFTQKNQLSQGEEGVLSVYKRRSETLSELLDRVRVEYGIDHNTPITYAGRLDPMADGLVIILVGDKCKEKDKYLKLGKKYRFTVLFGISTDTYDVLGRITQIKIPNEIKNIDDAILEVSRKKNWEYPPYSSKTVRGIPLFAHARGRTLPNNLPVHDGEIKNIKVIGREEKNLNEVTDQIIEDIKKVNGDFRQNEIIKDWQGLENKKEKIFLYTFEAEVSSGVYIRSIAVEIGKKISVPTLTLSITRLAIKNFS